MSKMTLRRYTQLAPLIHLLHRKRLTLLSQTKWDDKNDAYYLEVYRRRQNLALFSPSVLRSRVRPIITGTSLRAIHQVSVWSSTGML